MFTLLKKLFSTRSGTQTVVVIQDDGTKPSSSHRLNPLWLWALTIGAFFVLVTAVVVLLRFTPLGGLVYNQDKIRSSVIAIQQRVEALQDTIEARNMQLNQMKRVIANGVDTTFEADPFSRQAGSELLAMQSRGQSTAAVPPVLRADPVHRLPADAALISNLLDEAPDFPAPYPVEGIPSRTYNASTGHFGLDIAASAGVPFHAIADGVIISQEWTFNYGFVIVVQHAGGIVTIYKHARTVDKATGEVVRQGDMLGTVGDIGILSSGPHLHMEVWEQGMPRNPQNYLIKS